MSVFGGYIRVSRIGDRGESLLSPKLQERAIERWAQSANVVVEFLPAELDKSGGDDSRPVLLDAISRIERGELGGIAVWRFDRFTRSLASSLAFLERIEGAGGQLRSASEQLDASTPEGRMTRNFLLSIAQGEREQKAEQFDRAKADAIARGVHIGGRVPLGYRKRADKRLEPDPATLPAVADLFARKASGASWGELSRRLSARLGRVVIPGSVRAIIRNPVYLGEVRQGAHRNPRAHEPLVDRATWQAAQVQAPRPPRGVGRGPALLAGVVRCAGCSRLMTPTFQAGRRIYRCRRVHTGGVCPAPTSILGGTLEAYVTGLVLPHLERIRISVGPRTDAVDQAVAALEGATAELDGFQEAVKAAGVGAEHTAAGIRKRVEAVEDARRAVARARLASPVVGASAELGQLWGDLAVEERAHVLRGAVGVVWVWPGRKEPAERVRVVDSAHEPPDLSRRGGAAQPIGSVRWGDLPGEIGAAGAEDVTEGG